MVKDGYGYAASRLAPDVYPDGLDVDAVLTKYLQWCWGNVIPTITKDGVGIQGYTYNPEHIMEPVKAHPLITKGVLPLTKYGPLGHLRWTLDTIEDYAWIKNVYDFYRDKPFGFEDIMTDLLLWKQTYGVDRFYPTKEDGQNADDY
jgi:spore coat polysaccharide biosynthesis protein SpsF (cytidylyltransferase family)